MPFARTTLEASARDAETMEPADRSINRGNDVITVGGVL